MCYLDRGLNSKKNMGNLTHILSDFPHERVESVVDTHSCLGRRLDEADAVALCHFPRLRRVHVADGQVALVAH